MNKRRYRKLKRKAWSLMGDEPSFMMENFDLRDIARQCGISYAIARHLWVRLCIHRYHDGFYQRFLPSMQSKATSASVFQLEFVATKSDETSATFNNDGNIYYTYQGEVSK